MKAREISQLSRSKTPRDTKLLMGFDVPSGHHQTWQASANLKFTKDYTMDVEPQLRPGAPKVKATWSAPKYGYHKTSGLHVAAMNTTNLLARGASRTRKVTSVPQTVWQSCSRHRRIHFLSIHLFFFFTVNDRILSANSSKGRRKCLTLEGIISTTSRHHVGSTRAPLQALYLLSTRIQALAENSISITAECRKLSFTAG